MHAVEENTARRSELGDGCGRPTTSPKIGYILAVLTSDTMFCWACWGIVNKFSRMPSVNRIIGTTKGIPRPVVPYKELYDFEPGPPKERGSESSEVCRHSLAPDQAQRR